MRLVRQPHRAQAQQARRRHRDRSTTPPRRPGSSSTRARWRPTQLVEAVEAAGYSAALPASEPAAGRRRAGRDRRAAPPPDLRRGPVGAGAADGDDPGAAVRQLAVAVAEPRDAGRAVGGVAVPPGGVGEPQARRRDDGHADLASARSPPGCGRCTRCSSATPA